MSFIEKLALVLTERCCRVERGMACTQLISHIPNRSSISNAFQVYNYLPFDITQPSLFETADSHTKRTLANFPDLLYEDTYWTEIQEHDWDNSNHQNRHKFLDGNTVPYRASVLPISVAQYDAQKYTMSVNTQTSTSVII